VEIALASWVSLTSPRERPSCDDAWAGRSWPSDLAPAIRSDRGRFSPRRANPPTTIGNFISFPPRWNAVLTTRIGGGFEDDFRTSFTGPSGYGARPVPLPWCPRDDGPARPLPIPGWCAPLWPVTPPVSVAFPEATVPTRATTVAAAKMAQHGRPSGATCLALRPRTKRVFPDRSVVEGRGAGGTPLRGFHPRASRPASVTGRDTSRVMSLIVRGPKVGSSPIATVRRALIFHCPPIDPSRLLETMPAPASPRIFGLRTLGVDYMVRPTDGHSVIVWRR